MNHIDKKIIELINNGSSYNKIQHELGVYPAKISQVKTQYVHLLKNTNSDNSSSASSTTIQGNSSANSGQNGHKSTLSAALQNSSSDPKVLLRMREAELEHERLLKQMDYDEKERERDYERELHERELEKIRLQNEHSQEKQYLKSELNSARQKLLDMEEEEEYVEEHEEEEIDPDFESGFQDFVSDLLSWDGDDWKEEEVDEQLERISNLKSIHEEWCEVNGYDVDEFDQWPILEEAETDFNELKEKISNQIFSSSRSYTLSEEWKEKLHQFT
jgi:hypothetical protein